MATDVKISSLNLQTEFTISNVKIVSVSIQVEIAEFGIVGDELDNGIIGTILKKGFDMVQEIKSIEGVSIDGQLIDVSTLQTNKYREYIANTKDAGLVVISGFFYPGDLQGQEEMFEDSINHRPDNYTVEFPDSTGGAWTFDAFVADYGTGAQIDDAIQFMAALKITGESWLGYLESGGADNIYFVGADRIAELNNVVYWPPNDPQSYYRYAVRFTTDEAFAINATAGNHNIRWWLDGVYMGAIESDIPTETYPMSAGQSRKVQIKMWEDDKTPKYYEYMLTRTV